MPKLSLGCQFLDSIFHGGIPCGSITEIVGESGVGKTQLALQLLLTVQLQPCFGGFSGGSLYIHTDHSLPLRRLQELAILRPHLPPRPLDQIFVRQIHSVEEFLDLLPRVSTVVQNFNVKLIVIDSIASLFRGSFDNTLYDMKRRLSYFQKISAKLNYDAMKYGLAVVVINQIVDVIENGEEYRNYPTGCIFTSGRKVRAALGLSWSNCVSSRFFMSKDEEIILDDVGAIDFVRTRRVVQVVFSPLLPVVSTEYVITRYGICGF